MNTLCKSPRILEIEDFLRPEECAYLIEAATPGLKRAEVVDLKTGQGNIDDYRTGTNFCFNRGHNEKIVSIEKVIAEVCQVRVEQLEPIQVNRYLPGDAFKSHQDWLDDRFEGHVRQMTMGGQRVMTALVYLSEPEEGGETVFDAVRVKVKPKAGKLVLWRNLTGDGKPDERALHQSLPVVKGEKWAATVWVRERAFDGSEEAAHAAQKKLQQESEASLRAKLGALRRQNITEAHAEIMEICARRKLKLVPEPVFTKDGRIGAVLNLEVDEEAPA